MNVRLGHTRFGAAVQLSKILWAPHSHPGVTSHRCAIEKLKAHYAKLYNRIDQIYLDKLDGEVEQGRRRCLLMDD